MSVVVPFAGGAADARRAVANLARLRLLPGDEVLLVDNSLGAAGAWPELPDAIRVIEADGEHSAYYARNVGAERAANAWLLFTDADCVPRPDLIDAYLATPVAGSVGALAGEVLSEAGEGTLAQRWAAARANVSQARHLANEFGAAAATGNMVARARAWAEVGGFVEGISSGGDIEFCWRLREAGWEIEARPEAVVSHPPKSSLTGLGSQIARWAGGNAWQERRHPGASPAPPTARTIARAALAAPALAVTGQLERGRLRLVDGWVAARRGLGYRQGNASPRDPLTPGPRALAIYVDLFPAVSETFVASEARALAAAGWSVRIEAVGRPQRPLLGGARGLRVDYVEDQGQLGRLVATGWLLARHPLRSFRDLVRRHRWPASERLPLRGLAPLVLRLSRGGERHVHVHFASTMATHALRVGALAGVPVSVAAHGHDIYAAGDGLREKLDAAEFVAAPCDYLVRDLAALLDGDRAKVHRIVMGVDGERFRRRTPYPGERTVVAVGRYVEKKGFAHLIEAAGLLRDRDESVRLVIAGDGPLRDRLERLADELALAESVELPTAPSSEAVRELLERADLLAMPSVIASDGDRDSMPVVVKEALAMEVPVVASDEVGLPEMVRPEWGRLVEPGSPAALADAISGLLALSPETRREMGSAGRRFVLEHCEVGREADRLGGLIS